MRRLFLTLFPALALGACDPDSEPVGQSDAGGTDSGSDSESGGSAGSSTGSDSASGTTSPSTSDSASTADPSTTGSTDPTDTPPTETAGSDETGGCLETDCAPCPDGTVLEEYCDGDTYVCECIPVGNVCDLPTYVEEAATGKTVPVDCGTVTLEDPDEAWVAAHDCVVESSANTEAYTMIAQLQGIDSSVWVGYAGVVGFVYGESSFFYDGGGNAGGEFIWRTDCSPTPVVDCSPSAFNGTCLACEGDSTLVCSDPDA